MKTCLNCSVDISTRDKRAKRCLACAENFRKERQKKRNSRPDVLDHTRKYRKTPAAMALAKKRRKTEKYRSYQRVRARQARLVAYRKTKAPVWNENKRLSKYGLTVDDYRAKLLSQGGRCAGCRRLPEEVGAQRCKLYVDHDHRTGRIRDLLCVFCNSFLGFARDNVAIMRWGIKYIEKHRIKQEQEDAVQQELDLGRKW